MILWKILYFLQELKLNPNEAIHARPLICEKFHLLNGNKIINEALEFYIKNYKE